MFHQVFICNNDESETDITDQPAASLTESPTLKFEDDEEMDEIDANDLKPPDIKMETDVLKVEKEEPGVFDKDLLMEVKQELMKEEEVGKPDVILDLVATKHPEILRRKCYVKLFKEDLFLNNRHLFGSTSNDLVKANVKAESASLNGGPLKPLQEKEGVGFKSHSEYITPAESVSLDEGPLKPLQEKEGVMFKSHLEYITSNSCNNKIILETNNEGDNNILENDSHVEDEDSCSDWEADFSRETGVCLKKKYCKIRKSDTILNNDEEKEASTRKILKIQDKPQTDNGAKTLRTNQNPNKLSKSCVQLNSKANGANSSVKIGTTLNKQSITQNPLKFHKMELSCFLCDKQFYSFNTLFEHLMKVHNLHDIQLVKPSKKSTPINESHRKVMDAPRENVKVNILSDSKNTSSLQCPIGKEKINKFEKDMNMVCKTNYDKNMLEEQMLMCKVCEKFFSKDIYMYHIKCTTCSRPKKFQCEICGLRFNRLSKLKEHTNTHTNKRPFKCAECEKHFKCSGSRYAHEQYVHKMKRPVYLCCYCGITHIYLPHLLAHEQTHLLPEGAEVPTPFRCQECGKGFISKFKLRVHERNHKQLKCSKCPELFQNESHRYKHLETVHNIVKEYKCGVCNKVFKNGKSFACHKFVHTTVLSFFCDVCDKGFKQKHHLEQHLITHSDYRPIVCPECGETFKRKTHLKQHAAAFHGDGDGRRSD